MSTSCAPSDRPCDDFRTARESGDDRGEVELTITGRDHNYILSGWYLRIYSAPHTLRAHSIGNEDTLHIKHTSHDRVNRMAIENNKKKNKHDRPGCASTGVACVFCPSVRPLAGRTRDDSRAHLDYQVKVNGRTWRTQQRSTRDHRLMRCVSAIDRCKAFPGTKCRLARRTRRSDGID